MKNNKNILSITLSKENGDTGFSATMNLKKTGMSTASYATASQREGLAG